jgi:hypothetical protein
MEEWNMGNTILAVCIIVLLPTLILAKETDQPLAGCGYAFFAPGAAIGQGASTSLMHFGAGAEGNLYKGLGLAAEIGYLTPFRDMGLGVGVFSVDGFYRFSKSGSRAEPFVVGGYSLLFRNGVGNGINLGGGIDYWFMKKLGVRVEFRDYFNPNYLNDHIIQGRIGVTFR